MDSSVNPKQKGLNAMCFLSKSFCRCHYPAHFLLKRKEKWERSSRDQNGLQQSLLLFPTTILTCTFSKKQEHGQQRLELAGQDTGGAMVACNWLELLLPLQKKWRSKALETPSPSTCDATPSILVSKDTNAFKKSISSR